MATSPLSLVGHSSSVWTSSFSADASLVATSGSDETVRVWNLTHSDLVRGQEVACLKGHAGVVRGCAFSPDSALLATCSWDKCIHIYTSSDFVLRKKLVGHRYGVSAVQFSPNGRYLVSCSWDDSIGLWDVQAATLIGWLHGHSSPVANAIFLEGGNILASCSWDGTVRFWDLSSASIPQEATATLTAHPDAIYDISATPTDPNLLVTCGRKGSLILWDLRAQCPWQVLQKSWSEELNCVSFSPSGKHFIMGDNMGDLQLWDMALIKSSSLSLLKPQILPAHAGSVNGISFSTDGQFFASSSNDQTCRVWDANNSFGPSTTSVSSLAESLANQLSLSK